MHPMPEQGEAGWCGSAVVVKQNAKHCLLLGEAGSSADEPHCIQVWAGISDVGTGL